MVSLYHRYNQLATNYSATNLYFSAMQMRIYSNKKTHFEKKNPYIIHRTSLGCYERTLALLIEKYAGAFPLWLAPNQITVLTVSNEFDDYGKEIADKMREAGLRVELDDRNERIGYKIREAKLSKVPYIVVVGDKERSEKTVTVRNRKEESFTKPLDEFIAQALYEVATKAR